MLGPEGWGGVGDVEAYAKSRNPSPCLGCDNLEGDKSTCALECDKLERWQVETEALPRYGEMAAVWKMRRGGQMICVMCEGRLRIEDGVVYCEKCCNVHLRLKERRPVDVIDYLLRLLWTVEQVADLLELEREVVMRLARRKGHRFDVAAGDKEKWEVAQYALKKGTKLAARRFGVHTETVNKYMRDVGVGYTDRYKQLKIKALQMVGEGMAVLDVAIDLKVNVATVRKWKKQGAS